MFEDGANLFRRDAREPLDELSGTRAIFEVLEKRGDGHARAAKYPGSPDPLGIPFDSGASGPVDHATNGSIASLVPTNAKVNAKVRRPAQWTSKPRNTVMSGPGQV